MAHLTLFETLEDYNDYVSGETFVYPNISYCEEDGKVHYKQEFIKSMSAVFTIGENDGLTIKIANSLNGVILEKVDGVVLDKLVKKYTFEERGSHTVEYQFETPTTVPNNLFRELDNLTSVNLSGITNLGDGNLNYCTNMQSIGTNILNMDIGNGSLSASNITDITSLTINGNVGNDSVIFPLTATTITAVTVNGNVGDGNFAGSGTRISKATINGNLGNGNFGGCSITEVYIEGTVGNNNFGGVSTITAMTIDGDSVGNNNYFYNFDTLHIKGDLGNSSYISNINHVIVDGNMGNGNSPGSGCLDLVVGGNLGNSTFGGVGTLSAVTIGGNIGNSNFGGCGGLVDVSVGGNVGDNNFQNGTHNWRTVVIGTEGVANTGNVGNSNNFNGNYPDFTGNVLIRGNVGNSNYFYSGSSLTIEGNIGGGNNILYTNVLIKGDVIYDGNNISATTSANSGITIQGNVASGSYFYCDDLYINGDGHGIKGNVSAATIDGDLYGYSNESSSNWSFGGMTTLTAATIGGDVHNYCFGGCSNISALTIDGSVGNVCFSGCRLPDSLTINGDIGSSCIMSCTNIKTLTVNGDVGNGSITGNSLIESVIIDGDVGSGSVEKNNSQPNLSAVTLTENCNVIRSSLSGLTQLTVMATTPPTLGGGVVLTNSQIYVPAAVVDTYKAATGWSDYASNIQAIVTS